MPPRRHKQISPVVLGVLAMCANTVFGQSTIYPKEIRGYKVERATVELKETKTKKADSRIQKPPDSPAPLIQFGSPRVARITPLGINLEIPIVVSPVRQKGRIDFLVFEKMTVNGTSVQIDEYHRAFNLPTDKPLTLTEPLRVYVYLPSAVVATIDELNNSKEEWPVTGTVYVFGRFNKSILRFKRCIPVELNLTITNPVRAPRPNRNHWSIYWSYII